MAAGADLATAEQQHKSQYTSLVASFVCCVFNEGKSWLFTLCEGDFQTTAGPAVVSKDESYILAATAILHCLLDQHTGLMSVPSDVVTGAKKADAQATHRASTSAV
jgi:hypothetical protein